MYIISTCNNVPLIINGCVCYDNSLPKQSIASFLGMQVYSLIPEYMAMYNIVSFPGIQYATCFIDGYYMIPR